MKRFFLSIYKSQVGAISALPLLVIVAAVGVISYLLISSTVPFKGGLFDSLFPKTPSHAATSGFLETFAYGAPSVPTRLDQTAAARKWIILPGASDGSNVSPDGWQDIYAGHGPHCEAPLGNANSALNDHVLPRSHHIDNSSNIPSDLLDNELNLDPQNIYICNNHMMTTVYGNRSSQSLMARYLMDWSGGRTQTLQFDVNPYSAGRSAWWDFYIAAPDDFNLSFDTSNQDLSKNAIIFDDEDGVPAVQEAINYRFVPFTSQGGINTSDNGVTDSRHRSSFPAYCDSNSGVNDPACNDPRIRRTVRITFNDTGYSWSMVKPDGSIYGPFTGNWPVPLPFHQGIFKMAHWTYNTSKETEFITNPQNRIGQPFSVYTFHWANFSFDGPATPWKTGYPMTPGFFDTTGRGSNPTAVGHINVTSSDLRNPILWGDVTEGGISGDYLQTTATKTDPKDTTHWVQASINGGGWLDLPSIRDYDGGDLSWVNSSSMTFRVPLPAGSVHQGDNTVQFRSAQNSNTFNGKTVTNGGFTMGYVELQVDPNSDLPPANPGVTATTPPESGSAPPATATPVATPTAPGQPTPVPTPTPTVRPTATPTPSPVPVATPTPAPIPAGQSTTFGNITPSFIANDTNPYELGMKFRSSVGGQITGVRFYKGPANIGTHTGSLWNTSGTRLATATFSGESNTGWQQVAFGSPVTIAANTTYIVSYHTNTGGYAQAINGFSSAGMTSGPLTALQSGVDGLNGVFAFGNSSAFPNQTWNASNYWVDVLFSPANTATPSPIATPSPRPSATPVPTATPPSGTNITINFDSNLGSLRSNTNLNGQFPAGVINWGNNIWWLSAPWGQFTTNSISYNRPGLTSGSFTFVTPKVLVSIRAFNGGAASTVAISCAGNTTRSVSLTANQLTTITTGWANACGVVTITSTNGWNTNFDDLVYR